MSKPNVMPAPRVENPTKAALDALVSGVDVEQAVYGTTGTIGVPPESADSDPVVDRPDIASLVREEGDEEPAAESAPTDSPSEEEESAAEPEAAAPATPAAKKPGDVEEVLVASEDGTKRKILVDYSDKTKIKKAYEMAAGMRKAFAERDKVRKDMEGFQAEYRDLKDSWNALEKSYEEASIPGIIKLLTGKDDAYESFIQAEIDRREYKRTAGPEQLRALELEERLKQEETHRKRLEKQVNAELEKAKQEREAANQKALESRIHPAFERYRFAGKLGDAVTEERLDRAVWTQALQQLDELPENVELTRELVDTTFRDVATTFRKVINAEATKKTQQVVKVQKRNAQEAAANAVSSAGKRGTHTEGFVETIKNGTGMGDTLMNLLTGKLRL